MPKWSFEVVRGPVPTFGDEHDFVVAGAATRPIGDHFRLSSRCWSWTAIIARPFLLAKRGWETGGSVLTLLSRRDRGSARTLDIAAQIAAFHRGRLTVTRTTQLTGSEDFDAWVSGLLEGHSVSLQIEPAAIEPDSLRQRIIELDCRLLVLEASEQDDVRALVEHLGCDVVVIRH